MNNPFDWESFSKKLREQLPDPDLQRKAPKNMDFSWIEQYVEEVLSRTLPTKQPNRSDKKNASKSSNLHQAETRHYYQLKPKVMDTITDVIVRIDVPEGLNAKRIRVECNAHRMRIRVLPQLKSETIVMPAKVLYRRAKANYRHGVIEIKLPKAAEEDTFQPLKISYDE